jgi:hypothetical protein
MPSERAARVRQYDGSKELRSLADALAKLQDLDDFSEGERATITTFGWSLRKGVDLAFATLLGPVRGDRSQLAVHLPPCSTFSAKTTGGAHDTFGIALLHEAVTDAAGNVTLGYGEHVHAIQFKPEWSWRAWGPLDDEIVRRAIILGQSEHMFYWPVDEALVPGFKVLRYDVLSGWRIEGAKHLLGAISRELNISRQRAATALRRAGFDLELEPASRSQAVAFWPPWNYPSKIRVWRAD